MPYMPLFKVGEIVKLISGSDVKILNVKKNKNDQYKYICEYSSIFGTYDYEYFEFQLVKIKKEDVKIY